MRLPVSLSSGLVLSLPVVYSAPSGDLSAFLKDLGAMLSDLPFSKIFASDIVIDLNREHFLDNNSQKYEVLLISKRSKPYTRC